MIQPMPLALVTAPLAERFTAFALGLTPLALAALAITVWGAFRTSWLARLATLLAGAGALWLGLLRGTGAYFTAWQAEPDPPAEAFSDGGSNVFVLLFGWLPALALLGGLRIVIALARRVRR